MRPDSRIERRWRRLKRIRQRHMADRMPCAYARLLWMGQLVKRGYSLKRLKAMSTWQIMQTLEHHA